MDHRERQPHGCLSCVTLSCRTHRESDLGQLAEQRSSRSQCCRVSEFAGAQSASATPQPPAAEYSIPLLSPEQMSADDQAVALRQQLAIAESAQFYGYTLDSSYTYRQMGCPVAPNHLLLAYEATSPNGSISRFTAVVRRGSQGETTGRQIPPQIIPILHFGVVPFIPAIANPHSIEVFNAAISPAPSAIEVLSATQAGSQPLLVRALCYLAMVGEEPAALGRRHRIRRPSTHPSQRLSSGIKGRYVSSSPSAAAPARIRSGR